METGRARPLSPQTKMAVPTSSMERELAWMGVVAAMGCTCSMLPTLPPWAPIVVAGVVNSMYYAWWWLRLPDAEDHKLLVWVGGACCWYFMGVLAVVFAPSSSS